MSPHRHSVRRRSSRGAFCSLLGGEDSGVRTCWLPRSSLSRFEHLEAPSFRRRLSREVLLVPPVDGFAHLPRLLALEARAPLRRRLTLRLAEPPPLLRLRQRPRRLLRDAPRCLLAGGGRLVFDFNGVC